MNINIEEKYKKIVDFFYEISKVPRNSTEEEKIANWLCEFAISRNLEYRKDELNNVLIKKKASNGYENRKPIIFQAHTDMVCEKTGESNHNFKEDPIKIINNGEVLKAKDTTLGADDGIGMSFLLLLLDDDEIMHPEIHCLFTTQEEIGMDGAKNFNYEGINAKYLINIDGEEENTAIVGCAGGARVKYEKTVEYNEATENCYKIEISGFRGGHSGVDINKGRQNSNILCGRILEKIEDIKIGYFYGGNKDNAIPNYTKCTFISSLKKEEIENIISEVIEETNFVEEDLRYKIDLSILESSKFISNIESEKFLNMLLNLKQGVIEMSTDKEGLVETSGNVGIVKIEEGKISIAELLRSSDDEKREEVQKTNDELASENNYLIKVESKYPGWKYKPNSNLERIYIESYKEVHDGNMPKVEAIHAGVECGMIFKKMPWLELISLGPDIVDVHTTNETLYLESCKKVLRTILKMIEKLD